MSEEKDIPSEAEESTVVRLAEAKLIELGTLGKVVESTLAEARLMVLAALTEPEPGRWVKVVESTPSEARLIALAALADAAAARPPEAVMGKLAETALAALAGVLPARTLEQLSSELQKPTTLIFSQDLVDLILTPDLLGTVVLPYLTAITEIQHIINEIEGETSSGVKIRSITQNSPITATVDGIAKATQIIVELVIPWRREHAQKLAAIEEQEKLAVIEKTKAEVLEIRARAAKDRTEKDRLQAEIERQYAEAEKVRLENEKAKLELTEAKLDLALKFLERVKPDLSEKEKIAFTIKLLPLLETIISGPLEMTLLDQNTTND